VEASTTGPVSIGTAYAATQPAPGTGHVFAAPVARPELQPPPAGANAVTRTSSRSPLYIGGAVSAVLVVGAAVFLGNRHGPGEHAALPAAASAAAIAPDLPAAAGPPAATESVTAAAPSASTVASVAPSATALPPPPRTTATGALTTVAAPAPRPSPAVSSKPKDSVQSSGF